MSDYKYNQRRYDDKRTLFPKQTVQLNRGTIEGTMFHFHLMKTIVYCFFGMVHPTKLDLFIPEKFIFFRDNSLFQFSPRILTRYSPVLINFLRCLQTQILTSCLIIWLPNWGKEKQRTSAGPRRNGTDNLFRVPCQNPYCQTLG